MAEANNQMAADTAGAYSGPGWYWDPWAYDYAYMGFGPFASPFGLGFYPFGWGGFYPYGGGFYGGYYGHYRYGHAGNRHGVAAAARSGAEPRPLRRLPQQQRFRRLPQRRQVLAASTAVADIANVGRG